MMQPYTPGTPVRPGYRVIWIPATTARGDERIPVQVPIDPRTPPQSLVLA